MKDFIYQIDNHECGYASLKMLLASIHKNPAYLYMSHPKGENYQYSLLELKEKAKEEGVLLSGYIIKNFNDLIHLKTPYILVKTLANGNKHAVLIKHHYKYFTRVYDPSEGKKLVLNKSLFKEVGNGVEVLSVESTNQVVRRYEVEPLISSKDYFKIILVEVLTILAYFFSAYFIDHESHFLYPIILMVAGVLFAIFYKVTTYKVMNKFDEEYIRYTYSVNKKERENNYRLMHKTKSGLLSSISNIILTLSSALMINVILILQNLFAIFVILTASALVLADGFIFTPKIKRKAKDLERMERDTLDADDLSKEEYLNNYIEIKESTYKIAKLIDLKRIVMFFVLLMVTMLMSAVTENANINFVLFFFAMSIFTYVSLDNVYKMSESYKENIINQTKFYDLVNKYREKEGK